MAISFHGVVSHAAHVDGPFPNIFQVCMALSTIRYFNIDTLSVFTGRRERLGEQSVHICTSFTLGDCTRLSVLRRRIGWQNGRTEMDEPLWRGLHAHGFDNVSVMFGLMYEVKVPRYVFPPLPLFSCRHYQWSDMIIEIHVGLIDKKNED